MNIDEDLEVEYDAATDEEEAATTDEEEAAATEEEAAATEEEAAATAEEPIITEWVRIMSPGCQGVGECLYSLIRHKCDALVESRLESIGEQPKKFRALFFKSSRHNLDDSHVFTDDSSTSYVAYHKNYLNDVDKVDDLEAEKGDVHHVQCMIPKKNTANSVNVRVVLYKDKAELQQCAFLYHGPRNIYNGSWWKVYLPPPHFYAAMGVANKFVVNPQLSQHLLDRLEQLQNRISDTNETTPFPVPHQQGPPISRGTPLWWWIPQLRDCYRSVIRPQVVLFYQISVNNAVCDVLLDLETERVNIINPTDDTMNSIETINWDTYYICSKILMGVYMYDSHKNTEHFEPYCELEGTQDAAFKTIIFSTIQDMPNLTQLNIPTPPHGGTWKKNDLPKKMGHASVIVRAKFAEYIPDKKSIVHIESIHSPCLVQTINVSLTPENHLDWQTNPQSVASDGSSHYNTVDEQRIKTRLEEKGEKGEKREMEIAMVRGLLAHVKIQNSVARSISYLDRRAWCVLHLNDVDLGTHPRMLLLRAPRQTTRNSDGDATPRIDSNQLAANPGITLYASRFQEFLLEGSGCVVEHDLTRENRALYSASCAHSGDACVAMRSYAALHTRATTMCVEESQHPHFHHAAKPSRAAPNLDVDHDLEGDGAGDVEVKIEPRPSIGMSGSRYAVPAVVHHMCHPFNQCNSVAVEVASVTGSRTGPRHPPPKPPPPQKKLEGIKIFLKKSEEEFSKNKKNKKIQELEKKFKKMGGKRKRNPHLFCDCRKCWNVEDEDIGEVISSVNESLRQEGFKKRLRKVGFIKNKIGRDSNTEVFSYCAVEDQANSDEKLVLQNAAGFLWFVTKKLNADFKFKSEKEFEWASYQWNFDPRIKYREDSKMFDRREGNDVKGNVSLQQLQKNGIKPRSHQTQAVACVVKNYYQQQSMKPTSTNFNNFRRGGLLKMACGSGKTLTFLMCVLALQVPTVILIQKNIPVLLQHIRELVRFIGPSMDLRDDIMIAVGRENRNLTDTQEIRNNVREYQFANGEGLNLALGRTKKVPLFFFVDPDYVDSKVLNTHHRHQLLWAMKRYKLLIVDEVQNLNCKSSMYRVLTYLSAPDAAMYGFTQSYAREDMGYRFLETMLNIGQVADSPPASAKDLIASRKDARLAVYENYFYKVNKVPLAIDAVSLCEANANKETTSRYEWGATKARVLATILLLGRSEKKKYTTLVFLASVKERNLYQNLHKRLTEDKNETLPSWDFVQTAAETSAIGKKIKQHSNEASPLQVFLVEAGGVGWNVLTAGGRSVHIIFPSIKDQADQSTSQFIGRGIRTDTSENGENKKCLVTILYDSRHYEQNKTATKAQTEAQFFWSLYTKLVEEYDDCEHGEVRRACKQCNIQNVLVSKLSRQSPIDKTKQENVNEIYGRANVLEMKCEKCDKKFEDPSALRMALLPDLKMEYAPYCADCREEYKTGHTDDHHHRDYPAYLHQQYIPTEMTEDYDKAASVWQKPDPVLKQTELVQRHQGSSGWEDVFYEIITHDRGIPPWCQKMAQLVKENWDTIVPKKSKNNKKNKKKNNN